MNPNVESSIEAKRSESLTGLPARQVPTLRLSTYTSGSAAEKAEFTSQLFKGLKEYGFVILKDHGVDASLLHKAYSLLEKFYALPEATKRSYISKSGGGQRGYTPFGQEHAKDADVMDLKEFWHVGREVDDQNPMKAQYYPDNIWPTEVPEFESVFSRLYADLENAGQVMLEALTGPLEVDKDYFKKMTFEGNSILRLLHY
ncbi:MAG: isopenicillin N synthase family oxygenase, partial [Proteobacteria bacterium]